MKSAGIQRVIKITVWLFWISAFAADVDAEIIKNLDFFSNMDLYEDQDFSDQNISQSLNAMDAEGESPNE